MPKSRCTQCREPIWWVWSEDGNPIALDPVPVPGGTHNVDFRQHADVIARRVMPHPRVERHTLHADTCPQKGLKL